MKKTSEIPEISEQDFEAYGQGIDSTEQDVKDAESMMEDYQDMPMPEQALGGIYALFGQVISQDDVVRISNLSDVELGTLPFSVRGSLWVGKLGHSFGHPIFGDFFYAQAKMIGETSLSKSGFLINTFVTSKKMSDSTQKTKMDDGPEMFEQKKKKRFKMFTR